MLGVGKLNATSAGKRIYRSKHYRVVSQSSGNEGALRERVGLEHRWLLICNRDRCGSECQRQKVIGVENLNVREAGTGEGAWGVAYV